ncbi:hypothetical protein KCP73_07835 [Salmonella enterica subsp. enterica]|nr:hypothetical protein KCP73_07835 [Salmonella enterica subsp. enterica]
MIRDDQFEQALPQQTASALAAAAQKSRFRSAYLRRRFFRSLCSSKVGFGTVGEALKRPAINGVVKSSLTDSTLTVERELEDEVETLASRSRRDRGFRRH